MAAGATGVRARKRRIAPEFPVFAELPSRFLVRSQTMTDFFDTKCMSVQWDEVERCVQLRWKGFAQGDEYRTGMNKVLELLTARKASRWLIDAREMSVVTQTDQGWMMRDWRPRAIAAGLKKVAVVMPSSAIAQMSIHRMENNLKDPTDQVIATAYFPSTDEARAWLRG